MSFQVQFSRSTANYVVEAWTGEEMMQYVNWNTNYLIAGPFDTREEAHKMGQAMVKEWIENQPVVSLADFDTNPFE